MKSIKPTPGLARSGSNIMSYAGTSLPQASQPSFVSQEFKGDRNESRKFHLTPAVPCWEDIIELFKGVKSVRAFENAVEKAEGLYKYKHIPVQARTSIPDAEEIWLIMDGELELFAQYGELVFCGI